MKEPKPRVLDEPPMRGKVNWPEIAALAVASPGKWVEVPVALNPAVATQINRGHYQDFRPVGEWEAVTRRAGSRLLSTIYVRKVV